MASDRGGLLTSQPRPPTSSSSSSSSSVPPPPPPPPPQAPPSALLLSGGLSGLTSCLLLQPLDLLKTRLQQANGNHAAIGSKTRRLVLTFQDVVQKDGAKGLWRGTWPTVLRNVPGVAMYFYSVTELRRLLSVTSVPYLSALTTSKTSADAYKPTSAGNLLAGATARTAVGFVLCPITVVKARFESSNFAHSSNATLMLSLRSIYDTSGIRGLFRGFSATALRDAPYAGLYLMVYEWGKTTWMDHMPDSFGGASGAPTTDTQPDETIARVASGLLAGSVATLVTHPFDIIKTRLQTSVSSVTMGSFLEGLRADARTAGVPVSSLFLDGLGLRCARKAMSSAIGWGIFEGGRDLWVKREMTKRRLDAEKQGGSGTENR